MTNQFQNPEVEKLEDKTISKISPKKDMERVAEKMAEKASKAVHENVRFLLGLPRQTKQG